MSLKPLTVLFGTNSSGKSSLEQFFLMLRQTVESSDRKLVLQPGDRETPVNLGSFEEMIHKRDKALKLEFGFEWSLPEVLEVEDPKTGDKWSGDSMAFECVVALQNGKLTQLGVERFSYKLKQDGRDVLTVKLDSTQTQKSEFKLTAYPFNLVRTLGRSWQLGAPSRFYGFPEQVSAYYQNADFVQDFSLALEQMLRSVCYLGPLRSRGERLYQWSGGEPENVGFAGELSVSAMLAAKDRMMNTGYRKAKRPFQKLISPRLYSLIAFESMLAFSSRSVFEEKILK